MPNKKHSPPPTTSAALVRAPGAPTVQPPAVASAPWARKEAMFSTAPYKSWGEALPEWGVVPFFGIPGSGKSCLSWWLLTTIHEQLGRPVVAYGIPSLAHKFFPEWVVHVPAGDLQALRQYRNACVHVDEGAIRAPARRAMSEENVSIVTSLNPIARQAHQIILFIQQDTAQLDLQVVRDSAMTIFKMPSELHVRLARRELQPEVKRARELLLAKARAGQDFRQWSFVYSWHASREGLLKNHLAPWWTEQASEAFSLAQSGELDAPQYGHRRNGAGARVRNALQRG